MNRTFFVSLGLGFVFAIGLGVSGMTDPNKVIGFLNLTGSWDMTLAVVMASALLVTISAHLYYKRDSTPRLGGTCSVPKGGDLDKPLLFGAAIFGVGWGLGGFCPGPAVVSLVTGNTSAIVFSVSMVFGMLLHSRFLTKPSTGVQVPDDECMSDGEEPSG